MKNSFLPLFIIGLMLFSSFSLAIMDHMDGQNHAKCPFETAGTVDCTQVQNAIDFVVSHFGAVSGFFSAGIAGNSVNLIALSLLLMLAVSAIFNKSNDPFRLRPVTLENLSREVFISPNKIILTHWLAMHENSPAFI